VPFLLVNNKYVIAGGAVYRMPIHNIKGGECIDQIADNHKQDLKAPRFSG
jgi:hypothetical protein